MSTFKPDWALPKNVTALFTDRHGGVSQPPYDGFNLATHVGDNLENVITNRQSLVKEGGLPAAPVWLDQQHTNIALKLDSKNTYTYLNASTPPVADASWTTEPGIISVIMTADCLPVLLAAKDGSCVGAVHAGWKGLAKGILTKTIEQMPVAANLLTAWVGPAISARQFEVGQDVFNIFTQNNPEYHVFFQKREGVDGKYLADLASIAAAEMQALGVAEVTQSQLCTFEDQCFFSYRRDQQTGRIASLIWLDK